MIYAFFLFVFVQKSFLTKKFFLFAEINLTTRGPLYTCLVFSQLKTITFIYMDTYVKVLTYCKKFPLVVASVWTLWWKESTLYKCVAIVPTGVKFKSPLLLHHPPSPSRILTSCGNPHPKFLSTFHNGTLLSMCS